MKRKKKLIISLLAFIAFTVFAGYYYLYQPLTFIRKESYFSKFQIKDDKVYIWCTLTVQNNTDKEQHYSIYAVDNEDYQAGLIKDKELYAHSNINDGDIEYEISAHQKLTFEVVFIADFAEKTTQKLSRNLPEITLISRP